MINLSKINNKILVQEEEIFLRCKVVNLILSHNLNFIIRHQT